MLNYRFYWLGSDGRIDTASNLEFSDDSSARAHAERVRDGGAVEVWEGARKVFQLGLASSVAA